ncbi:MAG: 2-methylcitrate synthase [Gammaproteobacteria bacterium]|nr:MAG: 2-methylcitrate synthase [Gammaproteobacteria bacterium]
MTQNNKKPTGLRGMSAGTSSICTVGAGSSSLKYRGFDVELLAEKATFEEVAFLVLYGKLPNLSQLKEYKNTLQQLRSLPTKLKTVLESIDKDTHPMDVLRTGVSYLGNLEPESSIAEQQDKTNRLLAIMPSILNYWYNFATFGKKINTDNNEDSIAGHFLSSLFDKPVDDLHKKVMDASLILYAEHEFNASTFAARVCASTLSDIYSCITTAIGTLRGPLHGGANEAAYKLLKQFKSVDEAKTELLKMLSNKQIIMGFGHAVYKELDPRTAVIKQFSKQLSDTVADPTLYDVSCEVERIMKEEKGMFANADFYHASAYNFMEIPTELFTPIFVCSRLVGWCAHIMEQRENNRLIRPTAEYNGVEKAVWVDLQNR